MLQNTLITLVKFITEKRYMIVTVQKKQAIKIPLVLMLAKVYFNSYLKQKLTGCNGKAPKKDVAELRFWFIKNHSTYLKKIGA